MFNKIGNSGGHSVWNERLSDQMFAVSATWYGSETDSVVYGQIVRLSDGETREFRGRMTVERAILSHRIVFVQVSSVLGDVKSFGRASNVKREVEEFTSKAAAIVAEAMIPASV